MLKNNFQVAQKALWKSKFFSWLNMEETAMGYSACLLVLMRFLPGVTVLDIPVYKLTSLRTNRARAFNPVFSLRNE